VNHPTEPPPVAGPIGIANQVGDVFWQLGPVYTPGRDLSANLFRQHPALPAARRGRIVVLLLKAVAGADQHPGGAADLSPGSPS
jgi:hypothetical protein